MKNECSNFAQRAGKFMCQNGLSNKLFSPSTYQDPFSRRKQKRVLVETFWENFVITAQSSIRIMNFNQ